MAVRIRKNKFRIDLVSVISRSTETIKAVRQTEQARKEAEYQKAIANGLSYAAQLDFRQKQLDEERLTEGADPLYITKLETSINDTKRLARFEKIRNKYVESLNAYVTGKSSIDAYIAVLDEAATGETDPEMVGQLKDLLSKAKADQYTNEINAVKNRVTLAEKDQSIPLIDKSIQEIKDKRAIASINKNEDEVAMWDESVLALTSAKSKLQVENATNELTFKINKNNPKAAEKLNYINEEISKADLSAPLTYNGVTYPSMKAYWEDQRNQYLSSSFFPEVDKELAAETTKLAQQNAFGQIPVARIEAVSDFYSNLAAKPEFAPFAEQLSQKKIDLVAKMTTDLAGAIYDEWGATKQDPNATDADLAKADAKAETTIVNLETRFGVKIARQALPTEVAANKTVTEAVGTGLENLPVGSAKLPKNAAEILRAQDVYAKADQLAGTGKYVGQTADQIRQNAHNYANDIRSGKVNLDKGAEIPTDAPPDKGATADQLAKYAAAHNTQDLQNQQWWSQAPIETKKAAWKILQDAAMPKEPGKTAPTDAVKPLQAPTTKPETPAAPTPTTTPIPVRKTMVASTAPAAPEPVKPATQTKATAAPAIPIKRTDYAVGPEGTQQYKAAVAAKRSKVL